MASGAPASDVRGASPGAARRWRAAVVRVARRSLHPLIDAVRSFNKTP